MKNRKILIIILILLSIGIIFLSFFVKSDEQIEKSNQEQKKLNKFCADINQEIEKKNNFVIFIKSDLSYEESTDVVDEYIATYEDNNKIFVINFEELDNSCIKNIFEKDSLYETFDPNVNTMIGYKKGNVIVTQSNMVNYIKLEEQLDESGIIKAKEKKETATLSEVKKKINQDEYILFILTEENSRLKYEKILEEVFKEYDYDYVNYFGDEGKKIYSYIKDDLKDDNVFPKIIYYSNGKIIKQTVLSEKEEFEEFKESIESID